MSHSTDPAEDISASFEIVFEGWIVIAFAVAQLQNLLAALHECEDSARGSARRLRGGAGFREGHVASGVLFDAKDIARKRPGVVANEHAFPVSMPKFGTATGGGNGQVESCRLPNTGLGVVLCWSAKFRGNGRLYDGAGITPDIVMEATPQDHFGQSETVLDAAVKRLESGSKTEDQE